MCVCPEMRVSNWKQEIEVYVFLLLTPKELKFHRSITQSSVTQLCYPERDAHSLSCAIHPQQMMKTALSVSRCLLISECKLYLQGYFVASMPTEDP